MTTVAAVQGDGWAVVGADSRVLSGTRIYSMTRKGGKIASRGSFLIVGSGDVRALNIVLYAFEPPDDIPAGTGRKLDTFFTREVIPQLRRLFDEHKYKVTDTEDDVFEFIFVVNGVIYLVDKYFTWVRDSSGLYSMGSGGEYAIGVLQAHKRWHRPKKMDLDDAKLAVREALEISAVLDSGTAAPFNVRVQRMV